MLAIRIDDSHVQDIATDTVVFFEEEWEAIETVQKKQEATHEWEILDAELSPSTWYTWLSNLISPSYDGFENEVDDGIF